jgi:hypothetical protein
MANSSGRYAPYPSCFIQPDGVIVARARMNRAGLIVNTVDLGRKFYDPMVGFRELAVAGQLTNGPDRVDDPRSMNVTEL